LSVIGAALGIKGLWADGFLIGLVVSLPIRFLTPMAMSPLNSLRKLSAGLPTALLTTIMFLILFPYMSSSSNPTVIQAVTLVASGVILSGVGVSLIIRKVELEGTAEIHHSPMGLFRSFLDHWLSKTPTGHRPATFRGEGELSLCSFHSEGVVYDSGEGGRGYRLRTGLWKRSITHYYSGSRGDGGSSNGRIHGNREGGV